MQKYILKGVEMEEWVERKIFTLMLLCNEFTNIRANNAALLQEQFLANKFYISFYNTILVISKMQTNVNVSVSFTLKCKM